MNLSKLENLDRLMNQEIEAGELAGTSLYIAKDKECIYRKNFGYSNLEKKQPMQNDTIVRLYSMSKPITATAAMILLERGVIDLLDPVSMYLPGFKNQKVWTEYGVEEVKREATIQDLLAMKAGLVYPDVWTESCRKMQELYTKVQNGYKSGKFMSTLDLCNEIGRQPLYDHPGNTWLYGTCADVLGAVIEVASKMKFGEFLKKEIFEPLGMVDTGFYVPKEKQDRFAELYDYSEEQKKLVPSLTRHLALTMCLEEPAFESGGAGLVSTVDDYAKFANMLMNGGEYQGVRILSSHAVELLTTEQVPYSEIIPSQWDSMHGYGYGNLMRILERPDLVCGLGDQGEYGWDGWAGTYFFINPKEKLFMIYMVQRGGVGNFKLIRKLRNVIYSSLD